MPDLVEIDRIILGKAFRGELVPQDPADEPASALLDRLRAETAQTAKPPTAATRPARRSQPRPRSRG